jgi:phage tail-like protein
MGDFNPNRTRCDSYKNFKFRLKWDGRYVAGVSNVSALGPTTEAVEHPKGNDTSAFPESPTRTKYDAITLERGVTHDAEFEQWASALHKPPTRTKYDAITLERGVMHDVEFEQWASKVWDFGSGGGVEDTLENFRKDVIIEVYNEAGQLALSYKVFRCWVSEYQSMPDLDAGANGVVIQHLKLENEGIEPNDERGLRDSGG